MYLSPLNLNAGLFVEGVAALLPGLKKPAREDSPELICKSGLSSGENLVGGENHT